MLSVWVDGVCPYHLHRGEFRLVQFEFGEDKPPFPVRQHKVGEAFAIGSEDTGTNLMRCGVEYQPAVHGRNLLNL